LASQQSLAADDQRCESDDDIDGVNGNGDVLLMSPSQSDRLASPHRRGSSPASRSSVGGSAPPSSSGAVQRRGVLQFCKARRRLFDSVPAASASLSSSSTTTPGGGDDDGSVGGRGLSVEGSTERLLSDGLGAVVQRKIAKTPFKVLEAPAIEDDFYLNLLDWSSQNVLAVGLGSAVWMWNALTSQVSKLCDMDPQVDSVTSVGWSPRGNMLAIGTNQGGVQLWDVGAEKMVRNMSGHKSRVGVVLFGGGGGHSSTLLSGSRDRSILMRDTRSHFDWSAKMLAHTQEVCGLRWSPDNACLASGGNDNKLYVWSAAQPRAPLLRYTEHTAAVKAITWSAHQRGLLASGGGTADRCIRFWNTSSSSSQPLRTVDTGSQVCNLRWSDNVNELVSTHGYSQNQIIVWSYPSMSQLATLSGHNMRVLYLAVSPDGQTIATGAGDETLRFWNVFPEPPHTQDRRPSALSLSSNALR
jgi:cell division cycle 20-like protein 1, cofactor of APC complex